MENNINVDDLIKHYIYNDNIGSVEYISHMGSDKTIVNAARTSVGKANNKPLSKSDRELMKFLMDNGHTSPFEHCVLQCKFTVPLFVRSQHMRHRTWSFNEISRRYTSKDIQFYLPDKFRTQHENNYQASNDDEINPIVGYSFHNSNPISAVQRIKSFSEDALNLYNNFLSKGIAREQARMVLPQNVYTEYWGTCDLHNIFNFLRQRLDAHAQYEIRVVAEALLSFCKEFFPVATEMFLGSFNHLNK